MGNSQREVVLWLHQHATSATQYMLRRFEEEGRGLVFGEEEPRPSERDGSFVYQFLIGGDYLTTLLETEDLEEGSDTLLVLCSEMKGFPVEIMSYLAQDHGTKLTVLPRFPMYRGISRAMDFNEQYDQMVSAFRLRTVFDLGDARREVISG